MGPDFVNWLWVIISAILSLYKWQVCDLVVLSNNMIPNGSKRVCIATKTSIFISIKSSACRKDVFDEVQRVDYDKILIFRSDALVFADSSSKSYILWYGSRITKPTLLYSKLDRGCVLDIEFCKIQKVARKVCKLQWLK